MPRWLTTALGRIRALAADGKVRLTLKALRELSALGLDVDDAIAVIAGLRAVDSAGRVVSEGTGEWLYVFKPQLGGTTGLTLVPGEDPDMVSVAKTLVEIARQKRIEIRGGLVEGQVLDRPGVEMLALTPDKPTLRAMLLGTLLGPARGIAATLLAVPGGIARCLQARIDKEQEQAS